MNFLIYEFDNAIKKQLAGKKFEISLFLFTFIIYIYHLF